MVFLILEKQDVKGCFPVVLLGTDFLNEIRQGKDASFGNFF